MNNGNGLAYTPLMVRMLIEELFAGQTVPIQRIKTRVEEIVKERGGQLPDDRVHHSVTRALLTLKQQGRANNLERGMWSILLEESSPSEASEKPRLIETLDAFMKWVRRFERGKYVFRGVPNAGYGIQASAYRRPEKDRNFEKFLQINKDLIREARLRGYDEKDGRELKELEILADLQHFQASTCLIDFSYNAQVALWFACRTSPNRLQDCKKPKDCQKPPNGKVFAVCNQPPKFTEITPKLLKKDIDYFLKDGEELQLYHWQPRQQNHRIIAQQSIFLFGHYQFNPDDVCIIAEDSKKDILNELQKVSGTTEDRLFPDFEGFARLRGEEYTYTELTASEYKDRGFLAYESGDYKDAIADYDIAIDKNPDYAEAYYWRGLAKCRLKRPSEEAIADYSHAIRLNSNYAEAYYERGASKYNLKQYEEAINDLNETVRLKPDYVKAYYERGRVKYYLEQYEEAIVDYSHAIRLDPKHSGAYYRRGVAKYHLRRYEEAIVDFNDAIRLNPDYGDAYFGRGFSKKRLRQDDAAILDFDIAIRLKSTSVYSYYHRADAKFNLRRFAEARVDLEAALPLARQDNNDEIMRLILNLLHEIESRTAGGSEDE